MPTKPIRTFELENVPDKPNPFVLPKMPYCAECSIVQTDRQCVGCNALFCAPCFETVHTSSRVLSQHELLPSSSLQMNASQKLAAPEMEMCKRHTDLAIDHLCETCLVMVCGECGPEHHEGHSLVLMSSEVDWKL